MVQRTVEIKVWTDLTCSEPMKFIAYCPSAEKIGVPTFDLAGARAAESEVNTTVLMQPVRLIKELRDLLDFVDHHVPDGLANRKLSSEQFRVLQVATVLFGFEQIDPQGIQIGCLQQHRLSRLTGAPQEKGLRAGCRKAKGSCEHVLQIIMII